MNRSRMLQAGVVFLVAMLTIGILAGCAGKFGFGGGGGRIIEYAMPKERVLNYEATQHSTQTMQVMGQSIENTMISKYAFSLEPKGLSGKDHLVRVTVNSMDVAVTTPQGQMSPDVSGVVGKGFDMTLSKLGKEVDVSGAQSLTVNMGGQTRSMVSDFRTIFPDLPGTHLKVGDTWTARDTVTTEEGGLETSVIFEGVNTLQGFEPVDGLECAKITVTVTGTFGGKGQQQGADLTLDGKIEGTETWYFAREKGLFVKSATDLRMDGNVVVAGAQNMTIPMKQEMKIEVALVK